MTLIGIAVIIITVVCCVHVVYRKGFEAGRAVSTEIDEEKYIAIGREQVLAENILRIRKSEVELTGFQEVLKEMGLDA